MKLIPVSRSAANCPATSARAWWLLAAFLAFFTQQALAWTNPFGNPPCDPPDLTLTTSSVSSAATCGDLVTIQVGVSNSFTDLLGLQYSVNWDQTQLSYVSHTALPIGAASPLGDPSVGTGDVATGQLTYSWMAPGSEEDLPDGTVILTLTMKVVGSTGTASVSVTGNPLATEVTDKDFCYGPATPVNNVSIALSPITCDITGPGPVVCPGSEGQVYSGPAGGTWAWSISGDGDIAGAANNQNVTVDADFVCNGSFTLSLVFTDANGCVANCQEIVLVQDVAAPVLANSGVTCASLNQSNLNQCLSVAQAFDPTTLEASVAALYQDNCGGPVNATHTGTTPGGSNSNCSWSFTYEYRIEDDCTNSTTCSVTYTGGDKTPPSLINAMAGCNTLNQSGLNWCLSAAQAFDATTLEASVAALYQDNCGGAVSATLTNTTPGMGNDDCGWTMTYEYTIKDVCNNSTTCSVTYSGSDQTIPVITLTGPPVMFICYNTAYSDPGATALDNCSGNISGSIVVFIPPGLAGNVPGTYTVTYDVDDLCGNPALQVTRSVTVEPVPQASATPQPAVICSGSNAVVDVTTTLMTPSRFKWSPAYHGVTGGNPNPVNGSVAFGPGAINDGPLYNHTGGDIVVVYTITPYTYGPNQQDDGGTGDDCDGTPITANVTVKPEPVGDDRTYGVCSGTLLNIDLQGIVDTYGNGVQSSFSWVAANNDFVDGENTLPTAGSVIDNQLVLVNPMNSPQTVVYTVTPTGLNGCPGDPFTITVTVINCTIEITDPCSCMNNATTLTNGQFSETVEVNGPAGDTWMVVAAPGLYQSASPAPPASPLPIASGSALTEGPAGVYTLDGRHVDALGYSIQVTNGYVTLSISNTCYYPNPSLSGLNATYCSLDGPQTVTVSAQLGDGSGPATVETIEFELIRQSDNSVVAPQTGVSNTFSFNPGALDQGYYTLRVTFDGGDNGSGHPGCQQTIEESFEVRKVGCGTFPWNGN